MVLVIPLSHRSRPLHLVPPITRGRETSRPRVLHLEPYQGASDVIAVAGSISDVQNNIEKKLKVLNYKPHSVILKKGFKMACVIYIASVAAISEFKMPEEDSNPINVVSSDSLDQFAKDYKLDLNPELSKDDMHSSWWSPKRVEILSAAVLHAYAHPMTTGSAGGIGIDHKKVRFVRQVICGE